MKYRTDEDLQRRVREHYEWALKEGYEVVGVFLQGSWNYGPYMSDDQSDVDTKCLVLPTFEDLALNRKPVSFTHIMENDEHCDVKDIRLYMDCFRKQNVNFVEILFTKYYALNPKYADFVFDLKEKKEDVAHYNEVAAINCMLGMAFQKQKALCHPYEGLKEKLAKYGYDGKQLSHAFRMRYMLEDYLTGKPYEDCLKMSEEKGTYLMTIKRYEPIFGENFLPKEKAIELMNKTIEEMQTMIDTVDFKKYHKNSKVDKMLDTFVTECMRTYLKRVL